MMAQSLLSTAGITMAMCTVTVEEVERNKRNRELAEPEDWEFFRNAIAGYNRRGDTTRHEIKLSGRRVMAIFMTYKGWQVAFWRG